MGISRPSFSLGIVLIFFTWTGIAVVSAGSGPTNDTRTADSSAKPQNRSPFTFAYDVRLWGFVGGIGYRGLSFADGMDTIFWVYGGGGWQERYYYRYPDGGIYDGLREGDNPEVDPFYRRLNAEWKAGIAQGICFNPVIDENLLELFFFYKGRYDYHYADTWTADPILFKTDTVADRDGIFQNSFLTGVSRNDVRFDEVSRTITGTYAEASFEWGPSGLGNDIVGIADFSRLNLTGMGFQELFRRISARGFNLLSGYFCTFASFDVSFGNSIPLNIRQTFGGREPRLGLGDALRGADKAKYDSRLKFVHNLELRINGPAFIWRGLLPGFLFFFDYGFYNNLDGWEAGFLASTGLGFFLHFFNLTSFTAYIPLVLLTERKSDGRYLTPIIFEFSLQF